MESFNAIIKKELINHVIYNTFEDAKISIFNFIEKWYNRERIHGSIYNMTPIEFEQNELLNMRNGDYFKSPSFLSVIQNFCKMFWIII